MPNTKTCAACPAWHMVDAGNARGAEMGECRCNPPTFTVAITDAQGRGKFPRTGPTDWCYRGRQIMGDVGT